MKAALGERAQMFLANLASASKPCSPRLLSDSTPFSGKAQIFAQLDRPLPPTPTRRRFPASCICVIASVMAAWTKSMKTASLYDSTTVGNYSGTAADNMLGFLNLNTPPCASSNATHVQASRHVTRVAHRHLLRSNFQFPQLSTPLGCANTLAMRLMCSTQSWTSVHVPPFKGRICERFVCDISG